MSDATLKNISSKIRQKIKPEIIPEITIGGINNDIPGLKNVSQFLNKFPGKRLMSIPVNQVRHYLNLPYILMAFRPLTRCSGALPIAEGP